jgi:hypothetical protein
VSESLAFVQFPHPGGEHRPTGSVVDWNRGPHARKFLKATGECLLGGQLRTGPLVFWGEWEPQSWVVKTFLNGGGGHPRWLHDPYWELPRHRLHLQNTDPLVFGDGFLYSNCRQARNRKLRELAAGSLVVFGSKHQREFVVDTVFVVGDEAEDFIGPTAGNVRSAEWVRAVVFDRLRMSPKAKKQAFRLYGGTTYRETPAGLFSFVPCRPYGEGDDAFPRPILRLPRRWIEPNLAMSAKVTLATTADVRGLWDEIVDQVQKSGLGLGVRLDPPPNVDGVTATTSQGDMSDL